MRAGQVLLAGDAAHLTPPFLGQGLAAGLRDAANLAWKLDLVLRGLAPDRLLDTVDAERQPHTEWVIRFAIELGKALCELDPEAAAERDRGLRQVETPPPVEFPPYGDGVIHRAGDTTPDPLAGALSVQGRVAVDGREGLFDDVAGRGWTLITADGDPLEQLGDAEREVLGALDATVASLDASSPRSGEGPRRPADGVARRPRRPRRTGSPRLLRLRQRRLARRAAGAGQGPAGANGTRNQTPIEGALTMTNPAIHPKFHHFNLKTTRLQEMIDYYAILVGAEVIHQDDVGAWLSNDEANHRIALLAFPNFTEDPEKENHTGLHHSAFEYGGFDDLNATYLRLKEAGIEPSFCLDHGMTFSYYYTDPDGNHIELQVDNFGDWAESTEWMRTSAEFKANPIGQFVDPGRVADDRAAGMAFDEIHAKAMAGGYAPDEAPVVVPEPSRGSAGSRRAGGRATASSREIRSSIATTDRPTPARRSACSPRYCRESTSRSGLTTPTTSPRAAWRRPSSRSSSTSRPLAWSGRATTCTCLARRACSTTRASSPS